MTRIARPADLARMLTLSATADSPVQSLDAARARMMEPTPKDTALPVLAAAALCAACALALAGSVVLGPPTGGRATPAAATTPR